MKKLTTDNPFFEFMGNVGDWILLNLLFVLTSIPIITVGMSLTSLYRIVLRRMRGENNYVFKEYFKACKEEWKKSTIMWILFLLLALLLQFDLVYMKHMWKWFLAVKHLPYTICIVLLNAIPILCLASGVFATRMAMPVYFFFGFAVTARINCIFFNKIFDQFMNRKQLEGEDG